MSSYDRDRHNIDRNGATGRQRPRSGHERWTSCSAIVPMSPTWQARNDLLEEPAGAIRIAEGGKGVVALPVWSWASDPFWFNA
jgi:hypothetical protein